MAGAGGSVLTHRGQQDRPRPLNTWLVLLACAPVDPAMLRPAARQVPTRRACRMQRVQPAAMLSAACMHSWPISWPLAAVIRMLHARVVCGAVCRVGQCPAAGCVGLCLLTSLRGRMQHVQPAASATAVPPPIHQSLLQAHSRHLHTMRARAGTTAAAAINAACTMSARLHAHCALTPQGGCAPAAAACIAAGNSLHCLDGHPSVH